MKWQGIYTNGARVTEGLCLTMPALSIKFQMLFLAIGWNEGANADRSEQFAEH